jgi:ankyrin repeat protein
MSEVLNEQLKVYVQRGYLEDLKTLLNSSNISTKDDLGNNLLHIASAAGHLNIVEFLLNFKEIKNMINVKNNIGDTPLHRAAFRGFSDIVKLLLQNGSDVTIKNNDNKTAADLARNESVKKLLLPNFQEEENIMEYKEEPDED